MNAAASNSEFVGAPLAPRSLEEVTGQVSKRAGPSPGDFPSAGGGLSPNTFGSGEGITIGIAGASQPLWSSTSFNVWDMNSQTIDAGTTGLPMDLEYYNAGGIPTFSCGMSCKSPGTLSPHLSFLLTCIQTTALAIPATPATTSKFFSSGKTPLPSSTRLLQRRHE